MKRKLYIHNMGHATCAYLGDILGLEYIYESIDRDDVYILVRNAMQESAQALSKKYGVELGDIMNHIADLLFRFTNAALKDTCKRVGGDPKRKLSPADRLIGSSATALEMGITPAYIAVGAAAGLRRYIAEAEGMEQNLDNAKAVLAEVSELSADSELAKLILGMYEKILAGYSLKQLRLAADAIKAESLTNVI